MVKSTARIKFIIQMDNWNWSSSSRRENKIDYQGYNSDGSEKMAIRSLSGKKGVRRCSSKITRTIRGGRRTSGKGITASKSQDHGRALNAVGLKFKDHYQYEQAESYFEEALDILKDVEGGELYLAYVLDNLASLYLETYRYNLAIEYSKKALLTFKALGKTKDYLIALTNLAGAYQNIGQYGLAEKTFKEYEQIIQTEEGDWTRQSYRVSNYLGNLYVSMQFFDQAESYFLSAKKTLEELGDQGINYAILLDNLGTLYLTNKQYDKARYQFQLAQDIIRRERGTENRDYDIISNNLALLYLYTGKLSLSKTAYLQLLEKLQRINYASVSRASVASNLARVCFYLGEDVEAEKYLQLAEDQGIKSNTEQFTRLQITRIMLQIRRGEMDEGLTAFSSLLSEQREQTLSTIRSLTEEQRFDYFMQYRELLETFQSIAVSHLQSNPNRELLEALINHSLASKNLLFEFQGSLDEEVNQTGNASLQKTYAKWKDQKAYVSYLQTLVNSNRLDRKELDAQIELSQSMEKDIMLELTRNVGQGRRDEATFKDISRKLKPGEAALDIIRIRHFTVDFTDSVLYAGLLVKPGADTPELIIIPDGNLLEHKFQKEYQNSVRYKLNDQRSFGRYWGAFNEQLKNIQTLYLAVDGVYHTISLEGLLNPGSSNFLGQTLRIHYLNSLRTLTSQVEEVKSGKGMQVLGFPSFNGKRQVTPSNGGIAEELIQSGARFFDGEEISDLPGTKSEIEEIAQIAKSRGLEVNVYTQTLATESVVKSWDRPKVVHLATHGFFLPDGKDRRTIDQANQTNPLFRSGILLSNAKNAITSGGDGILTAYEARQLDLQGTELVVLFCLRDRPWGHPYR